MEGSTDFTGLARELEAEFAQIGHLVTAETRNATRGEMAALFNLGQAEGPLTPSELAAATHVTSARMANILGALEEKGLVTRSHSTEDRRRVEVVATPAGKEHIESCLAKRDEVFGSFLAELGEKDARELLRIIRRSRQIMEARREEGRAVCA